MMVRTSLDEHRNYHLRRWLFAGCLFEGTALDDTKTPCCHSFDSPFIGRRALSFCKAIVDISRVFVFSHGKKSRAGTPHFANVEPHRV